MPSNTTPGTAIEITSLPYTSGQVDLTGVGLSAYDPTCSTAHGGVWWKRTAGASVETIVFHAEDESGGNNFPAVSIWDADLNELGCANGNVTGSPARSYYGVDIPAGATRYIQVTADGGISSPAPIVLSALIIAPQVIPAGSLCIPSDLNDTPCVIVSADDGSILWMGSWKLSEQGEHFGGVVAIDAWLEPSTVHGFERYPDDTRFEPRTTDGHTIASQSFGTNPLRSDRSSRFFYCRVPSNGTDVAQLLEVYPDGTTGDSWTLPANSAGTQGGCPARDRSIYYYQPSSGSAIHRYDLVTPGALSDLIATVAGSGRGRDILVTAAGDILAMYKPAASGWVVQRITSAGSVAATYAVGVTSGIPRMDFAVGDLAIWIMSFPEGAQHYSRFRKIQLSDGAELANFDVDHMQLSLRTDALGVAQSCPIIVLQSEIALPAVESNFIGSPGPLAWVEARWRTPGSP